MSDTTNNDTDGTERMICDENQCIPQFGCLCEPPITLEWEGNDAYCSDCGELRMKNVCEHHRTLRTGTEQEEEMSDTDQYDTLLRTMSEGLLVSINNGASDSIPSDELRVEHSRDDETNVVLTGAFGSRWKITRDRSGDLVYYEVTEDGLSYQDDVITFEVIGLDE